MVTAGGGELAGLPRGRHARGGAVRDVRGEVVCHPPLLSLTPLVSLSLHHHLSLLLTEMAMASLSTAIFKK